MGYKGEGRENLTGFWPGLRSRCPCVDPWQPIAPDQSPLALTTTTMPSHRRTLIRDLAVLLMGAALLLLPGRGLRPAFSQGFCAVMNGLVGHVTFGTGGHVQFQAKPAAPSASAPGAELWDAEVALTDEGTHASTRFLLNARALGFIPLVLMMVLVLVMPLETRRTALAGALGSAAVIGIAVGWTLLLLVSTFSNQASMTVYQLGPMLKSALDLAMRTLVNPPAARFIAPLGLGVSIVAWQLSRQKKTARDNWHELYD
jgi:hypothetical protein